MIMSQSIRDKVVIGLVCCSISGIIAYGFGARAISAEALDKMKTNEMVASDNQSEISNVKSELVLKMSRSEFTEWERQHAIWAQSVIESLKSEDGRNGKDVSELKAMLVEVNNNVQKILGRLEPKNRPIP